MQAWGETSGFKEIDQFVVGWYDLAIVAGLEGLGKDGVRVIMVQDKDVIVALYGCDGKPTGEVSMNLACVGWKMPDGGEHSVRDGVVNGRCDVVCMVGFGALDVCSELIEVALGCCFGLGQVFANILCR